MSLFVVLVLLMSAQDVRASGSVRGQGAVLVLDAREDAAFAAISFLLDRRETVAWAKDGAVIVDSAYSGGSTARARNFAEQFGLHVIATDTPPAAAFELHRPRVGMLRAGESSRRVEEVLEEYKVPFTVVADRANLRTRFDAMVLCGAVTDMAAIDLFVREGGTLVAIDAGAEFAVSSLHLEVVVKAGNAGSVHFDPTYPVAFGMPDATEISSRVLFDSNARRIATIGQSAALVELPLGRGRVLLFGFEPRGDSARLLLNALYFASAQRM